MAELAKYKTNLINRLQSTYNNNCTITKNNYTILTNNVLKSRIASSEKTKQINALVARCNSDLSKLLSNLQVQMSIPFGI